MARRALIETGTDKRYVRRNKLETSFVESDDVGRSPPMLPLTRLLAGGSETTGT
jgi:hypothetical protein